MARSARTWPFGVIILSAVISTFVYFYWARDYLQLSLKFGRINYSVVKLKAKSYLIATLLTTTPITAVKADLKTIPSAIKSATVPTVKLLVNDDTQAWIHVRGRKILVHSAYLDTRIQPAKVRVLVTLGCGDLAPLYCRLLIDDSHVRWANTTITLINSGCSTIYDGHYVTCGTVDPLIPVGVQLFSTATPSEAQLKTSVILGVQRRSGVERNQTETFGVCVGRTFDWSDWLHLLFFTEFYLSQGATKIVFFHRSWTSDIHLLLKSYEADGLVDILSFPPVPKLFHNTEDPGRGTDLQQQNLNVNDCSWWLMGRTEFALVVDMDEFVMPRWQNETLAKLLQRFAQKFPSAGAFKFQNLQVHNEWPTPILPIAQVWPTFLNFTNVVFRPSFFSKLVCTSDYLGKSAHKPLKTFRVSQHDVHEMLNPAGVELIPPEEAVKIHLRKFPPGGRPDLLYRDAGGRPCVSTDESQYERRANAFAGLQQFLLARATERLAKVVSMQEGQRKSLIDF